MNSRKLGKVLLIELLKQALLSLGILLFFTFYFSITISNLAPAFTFGLILLPVTIVTANVFSKKLIPEYLLKQKYGWFTLYTAYTLVISIFFIILSCFYGLVFTEAITALDREFLATKNLYLIIIGVYMVILVVSLFAIYREGYQMNLRNRELQFALVNSELQLKQEELAYLKMQIHPHFLFNTLNTIYGSAISKNEQTPELILRLSNLLDYILYQTKKSQVSLQSEIDHLCDYIALEKMRYGNRLRIETDFPDQLDQIFIPPMLFLPLLENSFKHGSRQGEDAFIKLAISLNEGLLSFNLANSVDTKNHKKKSESSGIGLKNIKKRLSLIYPEAHRLETISTNNTYLVLLELATEQIKKE